MYQQQIASWEAEREHYGSAWDVLPDGPDATRVAGRIAALEQLLTVVCSSKNASSSPQERVQDLLVHAKRYSRLRDDSNPYVSAKHGKLRENAAVLERVAKEIENGQ